MKAIFFALGFLDTGNMNVRGASAPSRTAYVPPHMRNNAPPPVSQPEARQRWVGVLLGKLHVLRTVLFLLSSHDGSRTPFGGRSNGYPPKTNGSIGRDNPTSWGTPGPTWDAPGPRAPVRNDGMWKDGKHIPGSRNPRLEKELYGEPEDPLKQHTGINFEKYDDIPVEATGTGVPDPIQQFTSPPLDPVLLENIGLARYNTPTPVQKYSIPIVSAKRDLMACAQVSELLSFSALVFTVNFWVDWFRENWWLPFPHPLGPILCGSCLCPR